jgi:hypothetical protein
MAGSTVAEAIPMPRDGREDAVLRPALGATTMGATVITFGVGFLCWAVFDFLVYALPFMVLCSRLHKTIYVASRNMWRTPNRRCF